MTKLFILLTLERLIYGFVFAIFRWKACRINVNDERTIIYDTLKCCTFEHVSHHTLRWNLQNLVTIVVDYNLVHYVGPVYRMRNLRREYSGTNITNTLIL